MKNTKALAAFGIILILALQGALAIHFIQEANDRQQSEKKLANLDRQINDVSRKLELLEADAQRTGTQTQPVR